ncbi:hypothetical protein TWF106_005983 [Orbilia oligospora]|uniref:Protein kinase domain-containing protein n=1 Tax=Orbilia oligospora TaxID=2813651 RepID=A0A6G1MEH2_ORBOL|nr:hypothetical protein TWF679_009085 [Orbilia oligospora]KAF3221698.1 hypothetical protein TWF106_005983 [Orbilia oligospora]KAF3255351.1 hypothetical protein TWF192_002707 [Orbilia oligospora]
MRSHMLMDDTEIIRKDKGDRFYSMIWIDGVIVTTFARIHEAFIARVAGDCAVPLIGNVFTSPTGDVPTPEWQVAGKSILVGLIMEPAEFLNYNDYVTLEAKEGLKNEMINLLKRLHEKYEIIHGNVTPYSFMRWNGELRFIRFLGSRLFNEGVENYSGERNMYYLSPNNTHKEYPDNGYMKYDFPIDPIDDWYALALVVYELYAGYKPLTIEGRNLVDSLQNRKMPDLRPIEDEATRNWMLDIFQKGGALIDTATV